ncbi:MAG: M56 family metallopeptidase [Bryobacteraceae bacterium]|jgi:uncharacterized protein (TIGR03435 family)
MTAIQFLAEWALRSSALILGGTLILRALKVKDSSVRLAAWTMMLCISAAMPLLTATLPKVPLIRLTMPDGAALQDGAAWAVDAGARSVNASGYQRGTYTSSRGRDVQNGFDWQDLVSTIYFLLAAFFLLRLCVGLLMSARLLRSSRATGRSTGGIEIRESDEVSAPLTLGVVHASIVLPSDWRDWDGDKLDAVLVHERSHILRRDPVVQLLSAIHRAVLWYNPLSWHMHRSIVRAAEEASDDAAVAATNDRASYAELLLEFMQRSTRGANWQGIAMARYAWPEERIHRILDGTASSRGISRRRLATVLALGSPLAFIAAAAHLQQKMPARLTFEAASVKPSAPGSHAGPIRALPGGDGYTVQDATVKLMISLIYKVPMRQIKAGPGWLEADGYDIEAKADHAHSLYDLHAMFRNLLADRFHLKFHKEIKQGPVYALKVDASGSKMKVDESPERYDYPIQITGGKGWLVEGKRISMEYFCWWLGQGLQRDGRPVIDKTGLDKNYDFKLIFAPPGVPMGNLPAELRGRPSIFNALREQLGLTLQAEQGPVEYFVIDHVEKPAAN